MKTKKILTAVSIFSITTVTHLYAQNNVAKLTTATPPSGFAQSLIFDNGTNVGIGTSSPSSLLHLRTTGASQFRVERYNNTNQDNALTLGFSSSLPGGTGGPGSLSFTMTNPYGVSDMAFSLNSTTPGFILKASGNFGVGTINPTTKLEVFTTGTANSFKNISATSLNGSFKRDLFMVSSLGVSGYNGISQSQDFGIFWNDGADGGGKNSTAGLVIGPHRDGVGGIRIDKNGNVGIGTSNTGTTYKLVVEGKLGAREVNVNMASWADFVFEKNYTLMSLPEVEKYITENKHLPGIPSAKEVEDEGVNIGEVMRLQMQKIEELTLYLIEQKKQIEALELLIKK